MYQLFSFLDAPASGGNFSGLFAVRCGSAAFVWRFGEKADGSDGKADREHEFRQN